MFLFCIWKLSFLHKTHIRPVINLKPLKVSYLGDFKNAWKYDFWNFETLFFSINSTQSEETDFTHISCSVKEIETDTYCWDSFDLPAGVISGLEQCWQSSVVYASLVLSLVYIQLSRLHELGTACDIMFVRTGFTLV